MALQFGVGTLQISATAGALSLGKLQSVSLNISYENAQLRGGADVFPVDTQFFDGKIEGSFEHATIELSQVGRVLFGSGAFAGAAGSGTITVTGVAKPQAFQLVFSGVTNGITSTWKLHKVFIPSLTLDFSRTDYTIPGMDFICQDTGGTLLTLQQ